MDLKGYVDMSSGSVSILKCAGPKNGGMQGNNNQGPYLHAQRLYQDIVKARTVTNDEFQAAIDDAAPVKRGSLLRGLGATKYCPII